MCPPRATGHTARLEPRVHPRPDSYCHPSALTRVICQGRAVQTDTALSLLHAERSSFAGGSPCARLRREEGEHPPGHTGQVVQGQLTEMPHAPPPLPRLCRSQQRGPGQRHELWRCQLEQGGETKRKGVNGSHCLCLQPCSFQLHPGRGAGTSSSAVSDARNLCACR